MNIIEIIAGIVSFLLAVFIFLREGIDSTVKYVGVAILVVVGMIFLFSGIRKSKE
jgi:hypothetical protein